MNKEYFEKKFDNEKLRWDLLDYEFIEKIVEVLTFGAKKYSENSWQSVPNAKKRYFAALLRHIVAWRKGEIKDKESNIEHLAHAACNLMFLYFFDKEEKNENNS